MIFSNLWESDFKVFKDGLCGENKPLVLKLLKLVTILSKVDMSISPYFLITANYKSLIARKLHLHSYFMLIFANE